MSLDPEALRAAVAAHGRIARVVVAETRGSAPRDAGAAMLVWPGGQLGTIGGGALEWAAAAAARALLAGGSVAPRCDRHPLGPALGQCCGGAVTLVTEVFDAAAVSALPQAGIHTRRVAGDADPPLALARALRRRRAEGTDMPLTLDGGWLAEPVAARRHPVWVWGAGHVGRAVVATLAPLPSVAITWADTGPERFPDPVPAGVDAVPSTDLPRLAACAPRAARHLILTYSHALDLALCDALLARGFVAAGLIGSASKWRRFRGRLAALGHAPASVDRIACPIGEPALGKHPQAIAVGVAAALLRGLDFRGRDRPDATDASALRR